MLVHNHLLESMLLFKTVMLSHPFSVVDVAMFFFEKVLRFGFRVLGFLLFMFYIIGINGIR